MKKFIKNVCFLVIFISTSGNVDSVPSKFLDVAKIGESLEKQAESASSISSRFLDLGIISQLLPGFNQGSGGAGGRLNLPPNSQFYPTDMAQADSFGSSSGKGSPGHNQIGGFQYQQPSKQANQQQTWHQGQNERNNQNGSPGNNQIGGFQYQQPSNQANKQQLWQQGQNDGQINNQNSNFNTFQANFQRPPGSKDMGRLTTVVIPNHGNGQGASNGKNEGTLDDFFSTKRPSAGIIDQRIIFPDESVESTTRNSFWGKPVPVPPPDSADKIIFSDSGETPSQRQCVQSCPTTSEYNPVCGSDNVTYFNPGRLVCARNCGINVFEARRGDCRGRTG